VKKIANCKMFVTNENLNGTRFRPGMPTRESQMFEFFLGFFPGWLALIGISVALLVPLVQSCGNAVLDPAGQAPPLNAESK
jgi:hypothetical protein